MATASLAVLLATLSRAADVRWLVVPGAALVATALLLYIDVLRRFAVRRELVHGHGDQWVAGGALAICVLASASLGKATSGSANAVFRDIAIGLGVIGVGWVPILSAAELLHPRLTYDERRWATVFPLGMYAAAAATLGAAIPSELVATAARVWVWVATAVWAVVLVGLLRRIASHLDRD